MAVQYFIRERVFWIDNSNVRCSLAKTEIYPVPVWIFSFSFDSKGVKSLILQIIWYQKLKNLVTLLKNIKADISLELDLGL